LKEEPLAGTNGRVTIQQADILVAFLAGKLPPTAEISLHDPIRSGVKVPVPEDRIERGGLLG
jgi:hypothetical protein